VIYGSRLMRNVQLGVKNLRLHKLRSFLTMLGVVFGVSSVIAMLAVGEGASVEALAQIRKLGSNNIMVSSARPVEDESREARVRMSIYGLLYDDVERVADSFTSVRRIVPVKLTRQEGRMGGRTLELRVVGTTPEWFSLVRRPTLAGRVLNARDSAGRRNVVVLTEHGARRLLATEGTIGQPLRIGGSIFEVIGIIRSEGGTGGDIRTPDEDVHETKRRLPHQRARRTAPADR
jgi:putative ABC transport system permease protein